MDGRTDGQGDSYIPPQTLFAGGGEYNETFHIIGNGFKNINSIVFTNYKTPIPNRITITNLLYLVIIL
jgi:hypothetical protein